ncbi:protein Mis18-alpha [Pelobates fuscus]|uniref:protein Mis18-alpha n=1 Tax=Pelobates fuscus TaxID=191477 RepID=UPI002FE4C7E9
MDSLGGLAEFNGEPGAEGDSACAGEEAPAVFLCEKCKSPLGDTFACNGTDSEERSIMLKAVSMYVTVEKKRILSRHAQECGCVFENLICSGCKTEIGKIYRCTPKHLDYKRDIFCLYVDAVDSYVLGSSCVQVFSDTEEPVTFESRMALEEEFVKANTVLTILKAKVAAIEKRLLHDKG